MLQHNPVEQDQHKKHKNDPMETTVSSAPSISPGGQGFKPRHQQSFVD